MHSVKSCIGGCSLRTGTLIILYIPVVVYVLIVGFSVAVPGLKSHKMTDICSIVTIVLMFVYPLVIPTAAIYGVMQKKPVFMIFYLGFVVHSLVTVLFLMVIVALRGFGAAVLMKICITIDPYMTDMDKCEILPIFCLLLALEALQYCVFIVVLSYYHELQREIKQTEQTGLKVFYRRVKEDPV